MTCVLEIPLKLGCGAWSTLIENYIAFLEWLYKLTNLFERVFYLKSTRHTAKPVLRPILQVKCRPVINFTMGGAGGC